MSATDDVDHGDAELQELPSSETTAPAEDVDEELEELKRHVREMEEAAAQAGITTDSSASQSSRDNSKQLESDGRSVYVGQVEYSASVEELTDLFSSCGTVQRVTIGRDKYTGQAKGYAYVEFNDTASVENAVLLNDTEFKGRTIKVTPKRTNVPRHELPGSERGRGGGGRGGFRGCGGFRGGRGFRGRGRGGYRGGRGQPY